ncbi:MAG: glycosyltransferase family 25 protein, partial [Acetobacter sp.]|nr:glycosyltransferase family 25 protein [Acetobacter sp.]
DGALGCALSHAEQWRRVISSGGGRTIIEDDAVFCKNFEEEHKRLLKTLPETWDILLWGYSFYSPIAYDLLPQFSSCITFVNYLNLREDISMYKEASIEGDLFRLVQTFGLFCYSISPKGAKKFLEFCFPIRPIGVLHPDYKHVHSKNISIPGYSRPIDNYSIDIAMAALYPESEAYVCVPPLVFATKDEMTTETTSDV